MTALGARIFALLGLRALSEYDYAEYSRATDLSKTELQSQLATLIREAEGEDQATAAEAKAALSQFDHLRSDVHGRQEADFLLRQMHGSWLQRAQQLALAFVKGNQGGVSKAANRSEHGLSVGVARSREVPEDYLRLGVMRLLRSLPGYEAIFEYPLKGKAVDCVLRPVSGDGAVVLIEGKRRIRSPQHADQAATQILEFAKAWGAGALTAVLAASFPPSLLGRGRGQSASRRRSTFLLEFDVENNRFVGQEADRLVEALNEKLESLE